MAQGYMTVKKTDVGSIYLRVKKIVNCPIYTGGKETDMKLVFRRVKKQI